MQSTQMKKQQQKCTNTKLFFSSYTRLSDWKANSKNMSQIIERWANRLQSAKYIQHEKKKISDNTTFEQKVENTNSTVVYGE